MVSMIEPDEDSYRALSDEIAGSIAIVSTRSGRYDVAVTVDAFIDVSYDPPTMAVALYSEARAAEAVDEAESWGLSILASDQQRVADRLGTPAMPLAGLLDGVDVVRAPSGNALIAGAVAAFDLVTVGQTLAATHTLFIGEVRHQARLAPVTAVPLVRQAGRYVRFH